MAEQIDKLTPYAGARRRRRGDRMTAEERKGAQAKFIDALGRTANITAACMQVGISRSIVYIWQEMSDEFSYQFQEANKRANDLIFGEAWQRAFKGQERYVVSQGKLVTKQVPDGKGGFKDEPVTYYEKSDRMLELLLKARLPEFRDKQQVEHTGQVTVIETQWGTAKVVSEKERE